MRGIVAVILVVVATTLVGCNDEPEPRFDDPTEAPSESASASDPTSSAAAEPEPWEEKSKAGAVAFAEHWVEVFNEAQGSGDVTDLETNSAQSCTSCRDLAAQIVDIYRNGGSLQSSGWTVVDAASPPGAIAQRAEVTLRIDRSPQRVKDASGTVDRFPGGEATFSMMLVWASNSWKTSELVRL